MKRSIMVVLLALVVVSVGWGQQDSSDGLWQLLDGNGKYAFITGVANGIKCSALAFGRNSSEAAAIGMYLNALFYEGGIDQSVSLLIDFMDVFYSNPDNSGVGTTNALFWALAQKLNLLTATKSEKQ